MKKKEEFVGFSKHEYCPILRPQTETLLLDIVRSHHPRRVLEIGTFLGYSTSAMLCADENLHVTTLEKNEENFKDACENLAEFGTRVKAICCDAIDFLQDEVHKDEPFDLIFLDGPKGQYHKYLPYLKALLSVGGILVCDDILFYGLVSGDRKVAHKHRSIVEHLRKFLDELQSDPDFETKIFDFEDGVSVSIKKH